MNIKPIILSLVIYGGSPLIGADLDYEKAYQNLQWANRKVDKAEDEEAEARQRLKKLRRDLQNVRAAITEKRADTENTVKKIADIEDDLTRYENEKDILNDKVPEWESSKTEEQDRLVEIKKEIITLKKSSDYKKVERINKAIEATENGRTGLKTKINSLEHDSRVMKHDLEKINKDLAKLEKKKLKLEEMINDLPATENLTDSEDADKKNNNDGKKKHKKGSLAYLEEKLGKVIQEIESKEIQRDNILEEYGPIKGQLQDLNAALSQLDSKIAQLKEKLNSIDILDRIKLKERQQDKTEGNIRKLAKKISEGEKRLEYLVKKIDRKNEELYEKKLYLKTLREDLEDLNSDERRLEKRKRQADDTYLQARDKSRNAKEKRDQYQSRYNDVLHAYQVAKDAVSNTATNRGRNDGIRAATQLAARLAVTDAKPLAQEQGFRAGIALTKALAAANGYNDGLALGYQQRALTHPEVLSEDLLFDQIELPVDSGARGSPLDRNPAVDMSQYKPNPPPTYPHPDFYSVHMDAYDASYRISFKSNFQQKYNTHYVAVLDEFYKTAFSKGAATVDSDSFYYESRSTGESHGFLAPSFSRGLLESEHQVIEYCGEKAFVGYSFLSSNLSGIQPLCEGDKVSDGDRTIVSCSAGSVVSLVMVGKSIEANVSNVKIGCTSGEELSLLPDQKPYSWEELSCPQDKFAAGSQFGFNGLSLADMVTICQY